MITVLVLALILLSAGLVITVPVALATPSDWEVNKDKFIQVFQTWISLVLFIAATDGIVSSVQLPKKL